MTAALGGVGEDRLGGKRTAGQLGVQYRTQRRISTCRGMSKGPPCVDVVLQPLVDRVNVGSVAGDGPLVESVEVVRKEGRHHERTRGGVHVERGVEGLGPA